MNSWLYLFVAIPLGVLGTVSLKLSNGLQNWKPTLCIFIFYTLSFVALTLAIRQIPVSIIYAIWSGVGTFLVSLIGIMIFKESISMQKVLSLVLIILGVVGIHLGDVIF
jgi:small multidrug resistance pump